MNFERLKAEIEDYVSSGIREQNPLPITHAKGMISGVLALCDGSVLTADERIWLLIKSNECNLIILTMIGELRNE